MPFADLPGNLRMHYYDDDFHDPWKEAETVIFQHGNGKTGKLWYGWVPHLARDYRVIRVNARGFGGSTVPEPGTYDWSLHNWAADIRNLMDQLGIDKAHIVGETIGGSMSMTFAHDFPDRIRTLTVCTSPYKFKGVQTYLDFYKLIEEHDVATWVDQQSHRRLSANVDPGFFKWYMDEMKTTPKHVMLETLAALSSEDLTPIIPEIQAPTMVLVGGAADNVETMRHLAGLFPNGRLAPVEGVAGFVQHEAPAQCAAIWREFVRSVSV